MRKTGKSVFICLLALTLLTGCGTAAPAEKSTLPSDTDADTAAPLLEETAAAPLIEADGRNVINVSNVNELIAAIASDTVIVLADGSYELSESKEYKAAPAIDPEEFWDASRPDGESKNPCLYWEAGYDGYELVIRGVHNLSILGGGSDKVTIETLPRYADILSFRECRDISIAGLTAGHVKQEAYCTGGVLEFAGCENVSVDGCELFGCGILGVTAQSCKSVKVTGTKIYDCSYGAAQVSGCCDVLFDGCEVYSCEGYGGLFEISSSEEVALINSYIHDNRIPAFVQTAYAKGVYLGAVRVEKNLFDNCLFAVTAYPVTVEGCLFKNNHTQSWYEDVNTGESGSAVSCDGTPLTGDALLSMELSESVTWSAQALPAPVAVPSVSEDGAIHVSTVDEFLAAIAPDTKIYLEKGSYDLSTATGYGGSGSEYYTWQTEFDGPALVIQNVQNLTIMAEKPSRVTISAVPRYADVLRFDSCAGITLSGFTAGHTQEPGSCSGGVVNFIACDACTVESCSLYGCGILGIEAMRCEGITINETEIYDCSEGAAAVYDSSDVHFEHCDIHDNGNDNYIFFDGTRNITVNGKRLDGEY